MKKLLLLLAVTVCAACGDDDKTPVTPPSDNTVFSGHLTITSNTTQGLTPFEMSDVKFELTPEQESLYSLTMHNIRFASTMTRGLNIVLPKLTFADYDGDGLLSITSTVTPIVPYINDLPYDSFKIEQFSGTFSDQGVLHISFTCKNPQIQVPTKDEAKEPLNHTAEYFGKIVL